MKKEKPPFVDMWVTFESKKWIEKYLKRDHIGFEFGSGMSTIYLGMKTKHLISIEHRLEWYRKIRKRLRARNMTNVMLLYEPWIREYYKTLAWCKPASLDYVFLDGVYEARNTCVKWSWPRLKQGGILIFDNSDHDMFNPGFKYMDSHKGKRLDFYGQGRNPMNGKIRDKKWMTSIWVKG